MWRRLPLYVKSPVGVQPQPLHARIAAGESAAVDELGFNNVGWECLNGPTGARRWLFVDKRPCLLGNKSARSSRMLRFERAFGCSMQ